VEHPTTIDPETDEIQHRLTIPEINGLRRFNVDGLNWGLPEKEEELFSTSVSNAQRTVILRMLANAERIGPSGAWVEGLTSLQIALAASVEHPTTIDPETDRLPYRLTIPEINGLRRFNVDGLNWGLPAKAEELYSTAVSNAQRTVILRMLNAVPPQHQH